jgi:hypothetical protein
LSKPEEKWIFSIQPLKKMADTALIEKAKKIFENFLLRQGSRKTPERYSVLEMNSTSSPKMSTSMWRGFF